MLLGEVFTQKQLFSVYIQQNTVGSYLTGVFQEIAEMGLKMDRGPWWKHRNFQDVADN